MSKIESIAQIDNTLLFSIESLLTDGITDPISDMTNLMTFAQAVILFDKVKIPIWRPNLTGTSYRSDKIAPRDIFEDAPDDEYEQRWNDCFKLGFFMASSSPKLIEPNTQSIKNIRSFVQKILSTQGRPWPIAFRRHIREINKTREELARKNIIYTMDGYSLDAKYIKLSIEDKAALTYLWRSLYNVSLSIDEQRPYLHNVFRLPFVNAIYKYFKKQNLSASLFEKERISFESIGFQSVVRKSILPSLLGSVLSDIDTKEQIVPKILEIRDSKRARDFRSYYAELQKNAGEPSASFRIEKEIQHIVNIWSGIADPVPIPISVSFTNWSGPDITLLLPSSASALAQRIYYRFGKHHFRFIVDLLKNPRNSAQLSKLLNNIFKSTSTYWI